MKRLRSVIFAGFVASFASAAGCTSNPSTTAPGGIVGATTGTPATGGPASGTVGAQLQIAPGISISTVQYVITNPTLPGFATIVQSLDVSGSQTVAFSITLPVGTGYTLSLSAVDSSGDGCSGGPATFSVLAGVTNTVGLNLLCTQVVDGGIIAPDVNVGAVLVTADASFVTVGGSEPCAAVKSLQLQPNTADVGDFVSLAAVGIDPNGDTSDVTITWSGVGGVGTLTSGIGPSTTFECTGPGTETLTATAAIADGGLSCASSGSFSVTVTCIGDGGAQADSGAPDATVQDGGGQDSGVPDVAVAETGGPLVPCTEAGQTGCVQCQGNSSGICSTTESYFVQLDIAQGNATAPGPDGANGCYTCLYQAFAIDSDVIGATGLECEDLASLVGTTFTNGSGQTVADVSTCQAVVQCVESTGCGSTTDGQQYCYCGPGGGAPSNCSGTTSGQNGQCNAQEVAGFEFAPGDAHDILLNYTDIDEPSGKANKIFSVGAANGCTQCLK